MANSPTVSIPQYQLTDGSYADNYYLKAYQAGGTSSAVTTYTSPSDATGATKYQLNSLGQPESGGTPFLPHHTETVDVWIFPTESEADSNDTTNATQVVDASTVLSAGGTDRTSFASVAQIQDGGPVYAVDTGTTNTYTIALSPAITAYAAGQRFRIKALTTCTGASTLNVNGVGNVDIKKNIDEDTEALDIKKDDIFDVMYDGTNFLLQTNYSSIQEKNDFLNRAFRPIGTDFNISTASTSSLAALNGTDVVFVDRILEELRLYRWNGSTYALVGSGFTLTISGNATRIAICAMNGTDIAYIDDVNNDLRIYRFDYSAGTFSQVGSDLNITTIDEPVITRLSGTEVALYQTSTATLTKYTFNGTVFSQTGDSFSISGGGNGAVAAITDDTVMFIDEDIEEMRALVYSGTTWSQAASLSVSGITTPGLATLNKTDVVFCDATIKELRVYRYLDGSISQIGTGFVVTSSGNSSPAMSSFSETEIAFIGADEEDLRRYVLFEDPYNLTQAVAY